MSLTTTRQIMKFSRIAALGVVVLAALVTIVGKGGGGAPPPPANPAPTVTSMTPSADQIDVARDTTVTATFSEAMNAGTIDTSSFTLRNAQDALIPAAVTYDMNTNTATLTPNQPLNLLTAHTATLASTITSQGGTALSTSVNWDFLTVVWAVGHACSDRIQRYREDLRSANRSQRQWRRARRMGPGRDDGPLQIQHLGE